MIYDLSEISARARQAVVQRDWNLVEQCAKIIIEQDVDNAEGYFLLGIFERTQNNGDEAIDAFKHAIVLDSKRYDAAVELANQYSKKRRNADAANMLDRYSDSLSNSPRYLDLAGTVYSDIGLSDRAWPLLKRANELQPNIDLFQANLATCAVFLGKFDEGRELYQGLLKRYPEHRQNHYHLSRIGKATNYAHTEQMKSILEKGGANEARDIPMYFALAKELEDLEQWEECFEYYKKACDAVSDVANYEVDGDIAIIESIIENCTSAWLGEQNKNVALVEKNKTPIFIVGLPRTGTTLVERIISSHSQVSSLGETLFLQMALLNASGVQTKDKLNPQMIKALTARNLDSVAEQYFESVEYRLAAEPLFVEKLPFNFLNVGFIAKAWPDAKIIHMVRNPMDACFSMYKQVFTWAYKFSYSLEDLGHYYVAYSRLRKHWQEVLGDRFIEVEYETLVTDQEQQTRSLLDQLGLGFEEQCLSFEKNANPSTTASSVQVRSKVHSKSVFRWKQFQNQLKHLQDHLEKNGIQTE